MSVHDRIKIIAAEFLRLNGEFVDILNQYKLL